MFASVLTEEEIIGLGAEERWRRAKTCQCARYGLGGPPLQGLVNGHAHARIVDYLWFGTDLGHILCSISQITI